MRNRLIILALLLTAALNANEAMLQNITQLTSPAMGFQKAGEAYFSPDGKMISFQAVPEGETDYQIFTMNVHNGKIVKISEGFGACTCSYFHPNGKKMIFGASPLKAEQYSGKYKWDLTPYMNIYESNLDGTHCIPLTCGSAYHAECAYSPDGSHIVYSSNEDGSMNIYTMKSDGSAVKQLTFTKDCYNGGPFYSPDGKKIVFRADREKPDLLQVYMMDCDGSNQVQLTHNEAVNWAPFWHPSGKGIAYTTSLHGHHNYQIYFLNLENGKECRLTYAPVFNGLPAFNREGNKMMWTSKRGEDNTSQIFTADLSLGEWLQHSGENL